MTALLPSLFTSKSIIAFSQGSVTWRSTTAEKGPCRVDAQHKQQQNLQQQVFQVVKDKVVPEATFASVSNATHGTLLPLRVWHPLDILPGSRHELLHSAIAAGA